MCGAPSDTVAATTFAWNAKRPTLWLAHPAGSRVAPESAGAELSAHYAETDQVDQLVTAAEWPAEHRAEVVVEDPHRQIADAIDYTEVADHQRTELHQRTPTSF